MKISTHYELAVRLRGPMPRTRADKTLLRRTISKAGGLKIKGQWARRRALDAAQTIVQALPQMVESVNVTRTTLQSIHVERAQ